MTAGSYTADLYSNPVYRVTVTGPMPAGTVLTTTINGQAIDYNLTSTDSSDETGASIASNIAAAINANPQLGGSIAAAASANAILVTATTSQVPFSLETNMSSAPQNPRLYVSGRFLYDRQGNKVILRGVDLPLLDDWSFPGSDYLSEVAKTGANAIRIQWYINYGDASRPAYSITDLGEFLDHCVAAGIIPIVMLADETCQSDPGLLNSKLVPWWTSPAVVAVLKPREQCLILNLANELGYYKWADDPAAALTIYANAYKTAIAAMRAAGLNMPLMIDAPDCGITLDAFTSIGAELVAADPLSNILLSTHAYWAGYDGRPYIATAVANNLPIVFGEIANKQDETINNQTVYGYYDLDGAGQNHAPTAGFTYQNFLQTLQTNEIGWLAWSWYPDSCAPRNMSSDGNFGSLTPYGNDIVNNPTYGLKATAVRVTP